MLATWQIGFVRGWCLHDDAMGTSREGLPFFSARGASGMR